MPYEERLRKFGLTTIHKRRSQGDVIETHKIVTGKERVNRETFFQLYSSGYDTGD